MISCYPGAPRSDAAIAAYWSDRCEPPTGYAGEAGDPGPCDTYAHSAGRVSVVAREAYDTETLGYQWRRTWIETYAPRWCLALRGYRLVRALYSLGAIDRVLGPMRAERQPDGSIHLYTRKRDLAYVLDAVTQYRQTRPATYCQNRKEALPCLRSLYLVSLVSAVLPPLGGLSAPTL